MSNKIEFLIVGVNHHFQETRKLKAAERDAQAIFNVFKDLGLIQSKNCQLLKGKEVTPNRILKELDRIQNINDKELLFIYWAGHAEKIDGGVWLLTNESQSQENLRKEMIPIETLVSSFARFKGFKNYVLILDTCYSGTANDIYNELKPENLRKETRYEVLAACEKTEAAREDPGKYGWLTGILLNELRQILDKREKIINLSEIFNHSCKRLEQEKGQTAKYNIEVTGKGEIMFDISARPIDRVMTGNTDFLETAIGYGTKTFCNYLNDQIVGGVELIYFLGFDVWDGCLVYDGLIHGSIEQHLLEFIRHKFLDRDRLRSRYEKILATDAEEDIYSRLGIAGQCLRDARNCYEDNLKKLIEFAQSENSFTEENRRSFDSNLSTPTLEGLRYIGDLSLDIYRSEYEAYDLLLGLRSCLYIPVVEQFFDFDILTSSEDKIKQKAKKAYLELSEIEYGRKPLGGVLIAANRNPNGLELNEQIQQINLDETNLSSDELFTRKIRRYFYTSQTNNSKEYINFRSYLRGLNAVYIKKSEKKNGIRQGLHPSLVKKSFKNIKESIRNSEVRQDNLNRFVANIAARIETERLRNQSTFLSFAQFVHNGITNFLPTNEDLDRCLIDRDKSLDFIRIYLVAILWRDLRIEQDIYENNNSDIETYLNSLIREILQPQELQSISSQPTLNNYIIHSSSRQVEDLFSYSDDVYPEEGQVSRLILALINNLLDDLREVKKQPSEFVCDYLQAIAPIKKYVNTVSKLEGNFDISISQRIFCDLSHALSVWLVGLWILEESLENSKVKKEVANVMSNYFLSLPDPYNQTFTVDFLENNSYLKEDFMILFWGVIAAIHDIAIPVQRFKSSCEKFFCQFFGEEASSQLKKNLQFNIIDILDHPRFPIYKNAITSLYSIELNSQNTRERDWLECVFYRAVGKNVGHSTVGSLILVYELEPYSQYCSEPSMWRMLRSYLQNLSDSQSTRKEYGLFIPAYLAHAVAFSDLPKLQKLWREMQADWQPNERESQHSYFERTADKFQIFFKKYPLSYLLGLLETILEPTDNYNRLDERIIRLANPNNENYEDIFGYHSHFYVDNIQTEGEQNRVVLCLYLRLWENNIRQEFIRMNRRDIDHLYRDYQNQLRNISNRQQTHNHKHWYLYNQKQFNESQQAWRRGGTNEQFGEFWDINDNSLPIDKCLSPRAYKVLDMICRLQDFWQYFQHDQCTVKIKFENVVHIGTETTRDPRLFTLPDDLTEREREI
jgi:hypothetical protein